MYDRRTKRNYILLLAIGILLLLGTTSNTVIWFFDKIAIDHIMEEVNSYTKIVEIPDQEKTEAVNPPVAIEEKEEIKRPNDYWDYMKIPLLQVNFNELLNKNKDTVGWLKVNGTNINYPVVQTNDNKYYLTHAYDGSKNSAGWVFMDYRNKSNEINRNTIVYGHGRIDSTMFGSLKNITKNNWYKNTNNYVLNFSTPTENTLWQVFSVYVIKEESYYIKTNFNSDQEYEGFLKTIEERSIFKFNANLNNQDRIMTLSTCYGDNTERVVLHAKLIKKENR